MLPSRIPFKQLAPLEPLPLQAAREWLSERSAEFLAVFPTISALPIGIDRDHFPELQARAKVLASCIPRLVDAIVSDSTLRTFFNLSACEQRILDAAARTSYRVGLIRPDVLYALDGSARICEINARFPLNGFLLTAYLSELAEYLACQFTWPHPYKTVPALQHLDSAILGETRGKPILVLGDEEQGFDTRIVADRFRASKRVKPDTLTPRDISQHFCMLELNQRELVSKLDSAAVNQLITCGNYGNDIRTILLVHDKRFLALLSSVDLAPYISPDEQATLRQLVAPTFVLGKDSPLCAQAIANKSEWVLKPNRSGKGKGVIVGRHVSQELWQSELRRAPAEYVLQQHVNQCTIPIAATGQMTGQTPHFLIGSILICGDWMAPGIFRTSQQPVVNAASGGAIHAPVLW